MLRTVRSALRTNSWWLIVLAIALHLPSLGIGFLADDYVHQWRLEDGGVRTDLYDFGATLDAAGASGVGALEAWWAGPDWKLTFVRPLTSLWISFDHLLFEGWSLPYHVENLLAFGLCTALLLRVLRDLGFGRGEAQLTGAIFAVSSTSLVPVGWIANRNSLLELTLGLGALALLGTRPSQYRLQGALILALLATMAKESGVVFVLLVGWLAWRRGQKLAPTLTPVALAIAVFAWGSMGLETSGGFYPDPREEPGKYLWRYLMLLVTAPAALLLPIPADLLFHFGKSALGLALAGPLLFKPLEPLLRRAYDKRPEALQFLVAWFLLALAPQAGAPISDRLHFHATPASAALLATALVGAREAGVFPRRRKIYAVLALPVSAAALVFGQLVLAKLATDSREFVTRAIELADEAGVDRVVLTQAPNPLALLAPAAVASQYAGREDIRFVPLQLGGSALRLDRQSDTVLQIHRAGKTEWSEAPMESVFHTSRDGLPQDFEAFRAGIRIRKARPWHTIELSWTGSAPLFLTATTDGPVPLVLPEDSQFMPAVNSLLALEPLKGFNPLH